MNINDVSPVLGNFINNLNNEAHSVSGVALCVAVSADGNRVYVGGHSGVWISNDGGITFSQVMKPSFMNL